uniref:Ysc84 actin-binding domain-containing protein n=1 Tax=Globisporangium ultimum (strain ATCC 200006 / CBS 805.95 / DAOM BR144) TaxID=431595 RepID=K3X3F4_GLOUD
MQATAVPTGDVVSAPKSTSGGGIYRSNSFLSSAQAISGSSDSSRPPTSLPARLPSRKSFIVQQQREQQEQATARATLARADTADANFFSGFRGTTVFDSPHQQPATRVTSSASVSGAYLNASSAHHAALRDRSNSWAVTSNGHFPNSEHMMDSKSTGKLTKEINNAVKVVETFLSPKLLKDQSIPEELLIEAYGLVFLTVYKVGFLFSGKIGTGFVISRTAAGWSAPSFISSGGLGFGMMAGGEMVNYMIVLNSRSAVKVFTRNGQFQLGSELDLAVGPIGRAASASLNLSRGGIAPNYSYSHSVGLYGGIGLTSAVICTRRSLNAKLYGDNVTARQILGGEVPCSLAVPLWKALDRALGVRREYANGLPVLVPSFVGVACDTCGYMNSTENHACTRCQNLLVYSVSVHSGRRNTSSLVVTTNHADPQQS